ncbi:MAG: cupredoxin domain-containing protein [Actinomycetota bacterium]|nr:cupredoxin domain-containing protein [Actinomycetota bacterium]
MRAKRWVTTAMIGVIAIFGLGACAETDNEDERGALARGVVATSTTGDPRWQPEELEAQLNQEVSFSVTNEDDREHNFTLTHVFTDADNFVRVDVPAQQSRSVRFTIRERPRDGFLSFYCRFHQAQGMVGKIILT